MIQKFSHVGFFIALTENLCIDADRNCIMKQKSRTNNKYLNPNSIRVCDNTQFVASIIN